MLKYVLYAYTGDDDSETIYERQREDHTASGLAILEALGRNHHGAFIGTVIVTTELTENGGAELLDSLEATENAFMPKASQIYPAAGETQVCFGAANGVWCTWTLFKNVLGTMYPQGSRQAAEHMYNDFINTFKEAGVIS